MFHLICAQCAADDLRTIAPWSCMCLYWRQLCGKWLGLMGSRVQNHGYLIIVCGYLDILPWMCLEVKIYSLFLVLFYNLWHHVFYSLLFWTQIKRCTFSSFPCAVSVVWNEDNCCDFWLKWFFNVIYMYIRSSECLCLLPKEVLVAFQFVGGQVQ